MIAVDTNVLVRLVTNDDVNQSRRAAQLFASEEIFVSKTVLLETEWVLRGAYELPPAVIRNAFERLVAASSVTLEDEGAVARALDWYASGTDLADALHLASSTACSSFRTFDKSFATRANKLGATPPVRLP